MWDMDGIGGTVEEDAILGKLKTMLSKSPVITELTKNDPGPLDLQMFLAIQLKSLIQSGFFTISSSDVPEWVIMKFWDIYISRGANIKFAYEFATQLMIVGMSRRMRRCSEDYQMMVSNVFANKQQPFTREDYQKTFAACVKTPSRITTCAVKFDSKLFRSKARSYCRRCGTGICRSCSRFAKQSAQDRLHGVKKNRICPMCSGEIYREKLRRMHHLSMKFARLSC